MLFFGKTIRRIYILQLDESILIVVVTQPIGCWCITNLMDLLVYYNIFVTGNTNSGKPYYAKLYNTNISNNSNSNRVVYV